MALYFLLILSLATICSAFRNPEHCDYQFGDPNWGQSRVVYDHTSWFPRGQDKWNVFLPKDSGMISFICINVTGINTKYLKVAYSPIYNRLTFNLLRPAPAPFLYHVNAKAHGY